MSKQNPRKQTASKQAAAKQATAKQTAAKQATAKQATGGKNPGTRPGTGSAGAGGGRIPAPTAEADGAAAKEFSRRRLLGTVGAAGAAGLVVGGAGGAAGVSAAQDDAPKALSTLGSTRVPFRPARAGHQAGITTPLQAKGHLVAFDLAPGSDRKAAAALLRRWSRTAEELMAGRAPDADTGVALDAGPSSLTVTFGFGHSFFGRTGLTKRRPLELDPLPDFSADALDPKSSNGDLWIQIGADDALVAFHALRALQKDAAGRARLRWQMNGFNRTPGATAHPMTTRNLMGQIDGTNNPEPSDQDFDERIFVGRDADQAWMRGGSYAVVRRIRMLLDDWEKRSRHDQERVIGRRKDNGAPLTGGSEGTPMRLDANGPDGLPVIPANAHARIAAPESNQGAAMLRRPFSYHDGFREDGAPDAGLLFICWQADPLRAFTQVQRKLDRGDALSPFLRHEASGLFAVPPAAEPGDYVGQPLLEG
ncbi:iron uptake transporter deferrochelatase/peroxidase subunit [Streptomyces sp. Isolate_219]|uniref:iron uptake transporter deferrochelatase/peroxidase subunit n=1 Tax=Streptomyces sp. Isolate_219 TaxID=2950110 RepID=UPI0021C9E1E5|nr:iron uptake transporter deferrochelatase/peroxidase subunit [Streptomyces sp. Isolate_219]MCR8575838.1 iron uptake transporter deferrochelatase/peroxidase subunit [Streptomyces sp. Isolate_219]